MIDIGTTVYRGKVKGKVLGLVWPGPEPRNGVITLPKPTQRSNYEAIAYLVTFTGKRGPVKVVKGEVSRMMALPVRITRSAD